MNTQILTKINVFVRSRLIETFGIVTICAGFFLLVSIVSYNPGDPNFIYNPENTEIKNAAGFYGSVISDFLLQSFGLISIFLIFNFFNWGLKLVTEKKVINFTNRISSH